MAANARLVKNRAAVDKLHLGLADGALAIADEIVAVARPPDAEPFGVGLVTTGDSAAWVGRKKVGGTAAKPRKLRLQVPGVTAVAGWSFPGRFQEVGTIRHSAQPFATPAAERVIPGAGRHIRDGLRRRGVR